VTTKEGLRRSEGCDHYTGLSLEDFVNEKEKSVTTKEMGRERITWHAAEPSHAKFHYILCPVGDKIGIYTPPSGA